MHSEKIRSEQKPTKWFFSKGKSDTYLRPDNHTEFTARRFPLLLGKNAIKHEISTHYITKIVM